MAPLHPPAKAALHSLQTSEGSSCNQPVHPGPGPPDWWAMEFSHGHRPQKLLRIVLYLCCFRNDVNTYFQSYLPCWHFPPRSLIEQSKHLIPKSHLDLSARVLWFTCCFFFSFFFLIKPHSCSSWPTNTGQRPSRRRSRGFWLVLSRRLLERETPQPRGPQSSVQVKYNKLLLQGCS